MPAVTPAAKARRKAQKREYYLRNRERELARTAAWVAANPARSSEIKRAWRARNPDADRKEILAIYREAKRLGLSVDHIMPLKGANFSGLHVPWNLQLMPLSENVRKGNRYAG